MRLLNTFLIFIVIGINYSCSINKSYTAKKLKKDTDYFYNKLREVHPNINAAYSQEKLTKDSILLYQQLDKSMTRMKYFRKLKSIMANIKEGHTKIKLPMYIEYTIKKKKAIYLFPCNIIIYNNQAYVVHENKGDEPIPFGSLIKTVNNISMDQIIQRCLLYTESYKKECLPTTITYSIDGLIWKYFGMEGDFDITYITPKGKHGSIQLKGISSLTKDYSIVGYKWCKKYFNRRSFLPNPIKREKNSSFSYEIYADNSFAYLNYYKCNRDESNDSLLFRFFTELKQRKIKNLIIDARYNKGGSTDITEKLLSFIAKESYCLVGEAYIKLSKPLIKKTGRKKLRKHLGSFKEGELKKFYTGENYISNNPLKFEGNIYVLSGYNNFSAGTNFVAVVKDCKLGTVIGQETGGLASGYGDFLNFRLPNSKLRLQIATKYLVRPNKDKKHEGVKPDIYIEKTLDDLLYRRDVELEKAIEIIKKQSNDLVEI